MSEADPRTGRPCELFDRQYFPLPDRNAVRDAQEQVRVHRAMLQRIVESLGELGIRTRDKAKETKTLKLVEEPLWKISESFGKYSTRYLSETAVRCLVARRGKGRSDGLQHDHVVPRRLLVEMLFESPTMLERVVGLCIGCVVDAGEHRSLSAWEQRVDPLRHIWAKYHRANVRVVDCKTGRFVDVAKARTEIDGWVKLP